MIWLADYEAWGNTAKVIYSETKLEKLKVAKEHLQPIRFQGQHFDKDTGLHYNRFRYYDPDMGMFITRDPIGLRGGDNVFQYAPNPTNWADPLGLQRNLLAEAYNEKQKPWGSKHGTIFDGIAKNSPKEWPKYSGKGPFGGVCGAEGSASATCSGKLI